MKLFDLRTMPLVRLPIHGKKSGSTHDADIVYSIADFANMYKHILELGHMADNGSVTVTTQFTDSAQSLTALVWAVGDFCAAVDAGHGDATEDRYVKMRSMLAALNNARQRETKD